MTAFVCLCSYSGHNRVEPKWFQLTIKVTIIMISGLIFFFFLLISGGLASVIYTDTLQTVVLIAGAIVVTSMCKNHLDIQYIIMF